MQLWMLCAVVNAIHSWFSRKRQPEKTEKKNLIITQFIDNIYPFLVGSNPLKNSSWPTSDDQIWKTFVISRIILLHEKFLQLDWFRAVYFCLIWNTYHENYTYFAGSSINKLLNVLYVIFGISTTRDILKLPQISLAYRLVKLRITILKYH